MSTAYSDLKILHHPQRLQSLREGKHEPPLRVQLIPTNRCNQRCEGCAYRSEGYTSSASFDVRDEISWKKLLEIVNDCEDMGVKAIEITGGGEPTVHDDFMDLCHVIYDAGIDLGLVTNGTLWLPEHTRVLARAKWVRFSIDAGCAETYANYRHSSEGVYYKVRKNLRDLVAAKGPDTLVGVGFVVNDQNWSEVLKSTRIAKEDGADNVRISALFQSQGISYFEKFYSEVKWLCEEAEQLQSDTFRVFNQFGDRLQDLEDANPDCSFCGYSKLTTYLGADCNTYTCCNTAYNPTGLLGSFREQSFRKMWESEETRDRLLSVDPRKCPRCMYNGKNRTINYALERDPTHVNFI